MLNSILWGLMITANYLVVGVLVVAWVHRAQPRKWKEVEERASVPLAWFIAVFWLPLLALVLVSMLGKPKR